MSQSITEKKWMLTYEVSSKQVREAIKAVFILSDSTLLKVDRRFEDNLHIESAREMYCGLCAENDIDWVEAIEFLDISESVFKYRVSEFRRYQTAYEIGDWTPRVIAYNRRLCSVKRKLENILTGY
jgi:hypothetical protein